MNTYEQNILNFNKQLSLKNIKLVNSGALKKAGKPDGIIIAGMGGSGLTGDLIKYLAEDFKLKAPVVVWKDYNLPKIVFKNPLVITVSFSGNTEESISAFVKSENFPLKAVITSGGKLRKLALKHKIALALFSAGTLFPRQALGLHFYGAVAILRLKFPEFKIPEFDYLQPANFRNKGMALARRLNNHIIAIYSSNKNQALAYNWKIKFNETAKIPAFYDVLPEMDHNEIVGFENRRLASKIFAVFLKDKSDHPRVQKRFVITKKLLEQRGVLTVNINLNGKNILEKFWKAIILADWTAFYSAKLTRMDPEATPEIGQARLAGLNIFPRTNLSGVDPVATPIIDQIKKSMAGHRKTKKVLR